MNFWLEYGGHCLWSSNPESNAKYGYAVNHENLPLSAETHNILDALEQEYQTSLDWEYPPNPSPWTDEHKKDFIRRANEAYHRIVAELGENYEVVNRLDLCL